MSSLAATLGLQRVIHRPVGRQWDEAHVVLAWGNRPSTERALQAAREQNKPLWRVEDGPFRSLRPGAEQVPLSLVLDEQGIYFDARGPSRLEGLIERGVADVALLERAERALDVVRSAGLSKYNSGGERVELPPLGRHRQRRLLLVDQVAGDASIPGALASAQTFERMLILALDEEKDAQIVIKVHPEVLTGRKQGHLAELAARHRTDPRLVVWSQDVQPYALFDQVDEVWTVSSQLGFEALVAGKPVRCFGVPFYAGWGLTQDEQRVERRTEQRSLEELAAAAWILYPRYWDPILQERCELEDVLDLLALQRVRARENAGTVAVAGFSGWRRPAARAFLGGPDTRLSFLGRYGLPSDEVERVVVWGQRDRARLRSWCQSRERPLWRIEDGFLRSFELGSDLSLPLSLCVDQLGMYYDPTRPSRLEVLLESRQLTKAELARARALRETIVRARLSKYLVQKDDAAGGDAADRDAVGDAAPAERETQRERILVVGQVEDDASIRLGTTKIHTNADLLREVRRTHPNGYITYKPHPDVVSGNRRGAVPTRVLRLADHVELERSVVACLDECEVVATMTSLVGFEALLRNKRVVVYGLPFYAGWGLTQDAEKCARRTQRLTLDHLVHATLIDYPRYYNFEHGYFVTPERHVADLMRKAGRGGQSVAPTWARRLRRWVRYFAGELRER